MVASIKVLYVPVTAGRPAGAGCRRHAVALIHSGKLGGRRPRCMSHNRIASRDRPYFCFPA